MCLANETDLQKKKKKNGTERGWFGNKDYFLSFSETQGPGKHTVYAKMCIIKWTIWPKSDPNLLYKGQIKLDSITVNLLINIHVRLDWSARPILFQVNCYASLLLQMERKQMTDMG